jgi:hypothetical protein
VACWSSDKGDETSRNSETDHKSSVREDCWWGIETFGGLKRHSLVRCVIEIKRKYGKYVRNSRASRLKDHRHWMDYEITLDGSIMCVQIRFVIKLSFPHSDSKGVGNSNSRPKCWISNEIHFPGFRSFSNEIQLKTQNESKPTVNLHCNERVELYLSPDT